MNRDQIEEKDLLLVKKFRKIVNSKEKKQERKPVWVLNSFCLLALCAGLIVAGLLFSVEQPALTVLNDSESPVGIHGENHETPGLKRPADQIAKTDGNDPERATETLQTEMVESSRVTVLLEKDEGASGKPENSPANMAFAETEAISQLKPVDQNSLPTGIHIADMVSCNRVINRQAVSPQTLFSLKENPIPVVWMTVLSENQPFTLTHVYYVNGSRYCVVPLEINYPRMRTWSNVTLKNPDDLGTWRVEVMTANGKKLDQIEFVVVP